MFQVPLAIGINNFGSAEFLQMTGANIADYADLNMMAFLLNILQPVTLGNITGGAVFVGM